MIISQNIDHRFTIRNRLDLSVIKTVEGDFDSITCGLCYPELKIAILAVYNHLIVFDYEKMIITKKIRTLNFVFNMEKVDDEFFITG